MPEEDIIMKKLKTVLTLLLAFALVFSLAACGSASSGGSSVVYRTLDEILSED